MPARSKRTCLIIGPIGKTRSPERNHADMFLNQVVRPALTTSPHYCGVHRADHEEHSEDLSDRIFSQILAADLIVADLSFLNPNVFYELAFCHACHKRVIHCAVNGTEIPFDIRMLRVIDIGIHDSDGIEDTKRAIRNVAKAMFSEEYVLRNPVISAIERSIGVYRPNGDNEMNDLFKKIKASTGISSDTEVKENALNIYQMLKDLEELGYKILSRPKNKKR